MIRNILGHYRTGANKCISANGYSADDGTVGAKGGALFHQCGSDFLHPRDMRTGVVDIGEDHGRSTEDLLLLNGHSFVDRDIVLNLTSIAYLNVGTDNNILTNITVFPYLRALENVREVPNLSAGADGTALINNRTRVEEVAPRPNRIGAGPDRRSRTFLEVDPAAIVIKGALGGLEVLRTRSPSWP